MDERRTSKFGYFSPRREPSTTINLGRRRTLTALAWTAGAMIGASRAAAEGSSCFVAGTKVLMVDGSKCPIEFVRVGDEVIGHGGMVNRVVGLDHTRLGARPLYVINGGQHFVTAEHPFMTKQGWKSIDPVATHVENSNLDLARLTANDQISSGWLTVPIEPILAGNTLLWPEFTYNLAWETIVSIDAINFTPELRLYNVHLNGNFSYHADGYVVHNKGGDGGGGDDGGEGGGGGEGSGSGSGSGSDEGGDDGAGMGGTGLGTGL